MHFAIFVAGDRGGALTNVSISLAAGLLSSDHRVDLVVLNESGDALRSHYRDVPRLEELRIVTLGAKHTRSSWLRLARYLRKARPDVLFSQLLLCNIAALVARWVSLTRTRTILLEGTLLSRVAQLDARDVPMLRYAARVGRMLYPYADGIVAKSPDIERDLQREVGSRLLRVPVTQLPNAYVFERVRLLSKEPAQWPTPAHQDAPVILSVGRLAHQKAYDVLLEALAAVRCQVDARLVLLGDGPERPGLERLAHELGIAHAVSMPGWVANPWSFMRSSTVFALPSRWEGWPSALMEAAALGCPIVASSSAMSGATWLHGTTSTSTVPVDDANALAAALLHLLHRPDLRAELGNAASMAVERYDYRTVAKQYEAFAHSLCQPLDTQERPAGTNDQPNSPRSGCGS